METNELSKNAKGGTELMMEALYRNVDAELLSNFQIIPSRVRELKDDKVRVLWCHDLPDDPESAHLANEGWRKFHKIVFVSHFQRQAYINKFKIPFSRTHVLLNAITPFEKKYKAASLINIVYHTTPHRGLEILVPIFEKMAETQEDIRLHVFSSFNIYGWPERNKPYEALFKRITMHPQMKYYGSVSHDDIRDILPMMHIFAYPSIWPETSCISLMEAMSSSLICVHPNLAALPETAANWTAMYDFHEDPNEHAKEFARMLTNVVDCLRVNPAQVENHLNGQKDYADLFYGWDMRTVGWETFLDSIKDLPRGIDNSRNSVFVYQAG